jgi:hypothetical protein
MLNHKQHCDSRKSTLEWMGNSERMEEDMVKSHSPCHLHARGATGWQRMLWTMDLHFFDHEGKFTPFNITHATTSDPIMDFGFTTWCLWNPLAFYTLAADEKIPQNTQIDLCKGRHTQTWQTYGHTTEANCFPNSSTSNLSDMCVAQIKTRAMNSALRWSIHH